MPTPTVGNTGLNGDYILVTDHDGLEHYAIRYAVTFVDSSNAHAFRIDFKYGIREISLLFASQAEVDAFITSVKGLTRVNLASSVSTVSIQPVVMGIPAVKSLEVFAVGPGDISAVIKVYGAHTNSTDNGRLLGTLIPNGNVQTTDSLALNVPWPYMWTETIAVSGGIVFNVTAVW